jgi:hypothetical protein
MGVASQEHAPGLARSPLHKARARGIATTPSTPPVRGYPRSLFPPDQLASSVVLSPRLLLCTLVPGLPSAGIKLCFKTSGSERSADLELTATPPSRGLIGVARCPPYHPPRQYGVSNAMRSGRWGSGCWVKLSRAVAPIGLISARRARDVAIIEHGARI